MPIYSPHHVIPDSTAGYQAGPGWQAWNSTGPGAGLVTSTTATPPGGVGVEGVGEYALIALIGLLLALIIASYVMISSYRRDPRVSGGVSGSRVPLEGGYIYRGARAVLRRVFLEVRGASEKHAGRPLTSKTALELASILGGRLRGFAEEYTRNMYSSVEPSDEDVEEVKRLAGGLKGNW